MEANERGRRGRRTAKETTEKKRTRATEEAYGGSSALTEQSAPIECGRRETPRKSVFPIGDEECGPWGAERDHPPRFRRSVAERPEGTKREEEETMNPWLD
ncbi:hypothetical protein NDU88_002265 [Pleurodeles waltl]|uniref:Uncharacterized protein n=1 Tax=Pleurodeles waltl TaxID=8319 RepID=A0AAV7MM54_PLEWA|nr:hypothetical protein NDU88_002265 [Pleurodeles waltl]